MDNFFVRKLVEKFTNKSDDNGYIVLEETPIRRFSSAGKETKPDAIIIEVFNGDKIVIIIECKIHEHEFKRGKDQIKGYMRASLLLDIYIYIYIYLKVLYHLFNFDLLNSISEMRSSFIAI